MSNFIYLFIIYFRTLSVSQFVQREVVKLLVGNKGGKELKESGHNQIRGIVSAIFRVTEGRHGKSETG